MPPDQNPQSGRRQHFHRGRRGPDRRGGADRRPQHQSPERSAGDQVDVEQIMRDIRAQISQRHGIELSNQQIQELAARRLEAVLDPRTVKPALLDQLRRSAGLPADPPAAAAEPPRTFNSDMLYASHNGLVRFFRRLLNPLLKLLFDPAPLIQALNDQAREQNDVVRRDAERDRRQAEWNALHYTIIQRLVTEVSRASIEAQSLAMRVESLAAKIDFNERRVRAMETTAQPPAHQPAPQPSPRVTEPSAVQPASAVSAAEPQAGAPSEGARRRRRRRRGRRGAGPQGEGIVAAAGAASTIGPDAPSSADETLEDDLAEGPDMLEDEGPVALEPSSADSPSVEEPVWQQEASHEPPLRPIESIDSRSPEDEPRYGTHQDAIPAEPPAPQPSPAPDEPFPLQPGDPVEPGPNDR